MATYTKSTVDAVMGQAKAVLEGMKEHALLRCARRFGVVVVSPLFAAKINADSAATDTPLQ